MATWPNPSDPYSPHVPIPARSPEERLKAVRARPVNPVSEPWGEPVVPDSVGAESPPEYFCRTCNLPIAADRVYVGKKAIIHIMRVPPTCAGCTGKAIPHLVEKVGGGK